MSDCAVDVAPSLSAAAAVAPARRTQMKRGRIVLPVADESAAALSSVPVSDETTPSKTFEPTTLGIASPPLKPKQEATPHVDLDSCTLSPCSSITSVTSVDLPGHVEGLLSEETRAAGAVEEASDPQFKLLAVQTTDDDIDLERGRLDNSMDISSEFVRPSERALMTGTAGDDSATMDRTTSSRSASIRSHNNSSPTTVPISTATVTAFLPNPPMSSRDWWTNPPSPHSHTDSSVCANNRFVRWFCLLVVLFVIIPTGIGVIMVVLLPGVVFLALSMILYYSCTRDAIPLPVLLRAILFSTDEFNVAPTDGSQPSNRATRSEPGTTDRPLTLEEIQEALMRRVCLAIVPHANSVSTWKNSTTAPPSAQSPEGVESDFSLVNDHCTLYFSKPLGTPDAAAPTASLTDDNRALVCVESAAVDEEMGHSTQRSSRRTFFDFGSTSASPSPVIRNGDARTTNSPFAMANCEKNRSRDTSAANSFSDGDLNDDDDDNSSDGSMSPSRGTACDICLAPYNVGDVLAFSNNPLCNHVYHSDCITDWMQASTSAKRSIHRNQHSCPTCRSDFLYYIHHQQRQVEAEKVPATTLAHDAV